MDREKVIKGIDICLQRFRCGEYCPYYNCEKIGCMEQLREDALDLLKEQEPMSVKCIIKWTLDDDSNGVPVHSNDRFYDCPCCGQRLSRTYPDKYVKFCWNCGQAVKWDD